MDIIPRTRMGVFISSAQSDEGDFDWGTLRKRIKDKMQSCKYLNPFIIEDKPSEIPSNQFFRYKLHTTDLVVFLIKGELREGTEAEFNLAVKTRKPALVYFLKDDNPSLKVAQLKKKIQNEDYCTYINPQNIESLEGFDEKILSDVIENILESYQLAHFYNDSDELSPTVIETPIELDVLNTGVPTKTAVSYFKSSYDFIYDYLDLPLFKKTKQKNEEESPLHELGLEALRWLVTGGDFISDEGILILIEKAKEIHSNTDWYVKRWDAIKNAVNGDFKRALEECKKALDIAKSNSVPEWIINDILIDYRNFEYEIMNNEKHIGVAQAQEEIDKSKSIISLPVLDRYLGNVYSEISKDEIKRWTASFGTNFYGSNFNTAILNNINYFFSALLYGSFTHMLLARKTLAITLYKYGKLFAHEKLVICSLKMYILAGEAKGFEQTLLSEWDLIYSQCCICADSFWHISDNVFTSKHDSVKRAIIRHMGLYMSDECFLSVSEYMYDFESNVYWGNSEDYLKTLFAVVGRLDLDNVVSILTKIIKDKRFSVSNTLCRLIFAIEITSVDISIQKEFCEALALAMEHIISHNGSPQIIAYLESKNPEVFSRLASLPDNGIEGLEETLYKLNTGKGTWEDIVSKELAVARKELEDNRTAGVYTMSFSNPYKLIIDGVEEHFSDEMEKILSSGLFELCSEILSTKLPVNIIDNCLECLNVVMMAYINNDKPIPEGLITIISGYDFSLVDEPGFFTHTSKNTVKNRLVISKAILGEIDIEELLRWNAQYSKKTIEERLGIAECINTFLNYAKTIEDNILTVILSVVLQNCEDSSFKVREVAADSLVKFLQSSYASMAECKLMDMLLDSSPHVRNTLLKLCKEEALLDKQLSNKIIETMKNDLNYAIRNYANE